MSSRALTLLLVALLTLFVPLVASANSSYGQFQVSVNVLRKCDVNMQNTQTADMMGQKTVIMNCSRNTGYTISFHSEANPRNQVSTHGIGNGNTQVIPVYSPLSGVNGATDNVQSSTVLMTINY